MTGPPHLVFIHGTSGYKKPKKWLPPLNQSLRLLDIDPWDVSDVLKVDYGPSLGEAPRSSGRSRKKRSAKVPPETKMTFEANRADLSKILADFGTTKQARGADVPLTLLRLAAKHVRRVAFGKSAERYRRRRESVCDYVRNVLDEAGPGDLILIGYSLGSVVAADLLPQLRPDQHVRLLVTIGSPLGAGSWDYTKKRLRPFPYDQLDAWVNIHNRLDWVTGRRGLEADIPQVIDVRIGRFPWPGGKLPRVPQKSRDHLRKLIFSQHKARGYTRHAAFAAAIDWALRARE